jgi:adenosyl cobinamide kinase/adenosyl cobinamide phosphate guanylyltransferase
MTELATTLVLGGARSGKSAFAEKLIAESSLAKIYLATATAGDDEMKARVAQHRAQRGEGWITIEEPLALVDALTREATRGRAVLVDCLTLWLSNLMLAERSRAWPRAGNAARAPVSRRAGTSQSARCGQRAQRRFHRRRASALAQKFIPRGELICPVFPLLCSLVSSAPARPRCCVHC